MTATEDVILCSIAITKHTDKPANPDQEEAVPQVETPNEESNAAENTPVPETPDTELTENSSMEETMDSSSTPESKESTAPSEEQPAESSSVPESQSEPVENVDSTPEVIPLAAGLKADPSASLLKTVSNNEVQIEQPEEGAQFQIYLASAGSYENAKET